MTGARSPAVRRASLPRTGYAIRADDRAEMRAVIDLLRDVPRDALGSFADLLHHNRRLAGRLLALMERLQVLEPPRTQSPRQRLAPRPVADARAIAEGVFGTLMPARRERTRTITTRKGRTTVVERGSRQMEFSL